MQFDEIDVFRPQARHFVGGRGGLARAGVDVWHHQVAFLPRIRGQHRRPHLDGSIHQTEFAHLALGSDHRRRRPVHVHRAHQLGVRIGDHLGVHHHFKRRFDLVHRLGIHGGVMVILHRHLGELLESGAVGAAVFHAGLGENRRHGAGTEQAFLGNALAAATAAEQPFAHLLHANGQHHVVEVGLHRRPRLAECRGAGGAGVGDVHHRNARLADFLQDALPHHAACLAEIAAVKGLHVLNGQPAIVERQERRFRADLRDGLVRKAPELDHVYANDVCVRHGDAPSRLGYASAARSRGWKK